MAQERDGDKRRLTEPLAVRLEQLRRRLGAVKDLPEEAQALVVELEAAYEELRVDAEELRAQQEEIAELVEGNKRMRWQHQRLLEMLPVPVLVTDHHGLVRSVNPAAAALVGVPVPHVLRKPIAGFVAPDDRSAVRQAISEVVAGSPVRRVFTVVGRDGRASTVEAHASYAADQRQISWVLLTGNAPPSSGAGLTETLGDLATLTTTDGSDQEVLRLAAEVVSRCLGPDVHVSVNLGPPLAPTVVAATSATAQELDGLQMVVSEGPCMTAFELSEAVVSSDLRGDPLWPRLAERLEGKDAVGVVAVPLRIGDELMGALNAYVDAPASAGLFREAVEILAAGLAAVLHERAVRAELRMLTADMQRALASRAMIDQAKGIIIADRGCTADEAYQHLVDLSSRQHVKLRDLAAALVAQRQTGERRES